MDLEQIQELLSDAMEMAQDPDAVPPHIDAEVVNSVSEILSNWIIQLQQDDDKVDLIGSREIIVSATACAFIAGQLMSVQFNDYTNQTHRSATGNIYHIHNHFG